MVSALCGKVCINNFENEAISLARQSTILDLRDVDDPHPSGTKLGLTSTVAGVAL
jgi:hypothetical protein